MHDSQPFGIERFADDVGQADPLTRARIAEADDSESYVRALVALCSSRLLMPIVMTVEEESTQMAGVTLCYDDEVYALAFTGLDSLQAWDEHARPVPCYINELAIGALDTSASKLLIDVAGPMPFVVERDVLQQFSAGRALMEFDDGSFHWVSTEPSPDAQNGCAI